MRDDGEASHSQPQSATATASRELLVVWQGWWDEDEALASADSMDVDDGEVSAGERNGNTTSVIHRRPDPRLHSRQQSLSVASYADLLSQIHTHFPTRTGMDVEVTDETQQRVIKDESTFRKLNDGEVVLVFESAKGSQHQGVRQLVTGWSRQLSHNPHPSIVTYSQELIGEEIRGASRAIVYAISEFIDNSISALRKVRHRPDHHPTIRISFIESSKGAKNSCLVISDNGIGMDSQTLNAFARMADAPSYRGEQRENVLADARNHFMGVNISQWGIGAKAAAFFIGSCIIAETKQESMPHVLQLPMSQKAMFEKHKERKNAYESELTIRRLGEMALSGSVSEVLHASPYLSAEVKKERPQSSFCRIIITGLEERHISKLSDMDSISDELANIYHRFLHGPLGLNADNSGKEWLRPTITLEHIMENDSGSRIKRFIDLGSVRSNDACQYQLNRRGPVFRFELCIRAPLPQTHSTETVNTRNDHAWLRGEIFYLPLSVDGETHPELLRRAQQTGPDGDADDAENDALDAPPQASTHRPYRVGGRAAAALGPTPAAAAEAASLAASSSSAMAVDRLDADGNLIALADEAPIFDIYWHGRQIPLASVRKLAFMKVTPETKDCLKRMKGYLFTSFPLLTSRNKLRMSHSDLEGYLNDEKNWIEGPTVLDERGESRYYHTTSRAKTAETRWVDVLKEWKAQDANYIWDKRHFLDDESMKQGKDLYSEVTIHDSRTSADYRTLRRGVIYKLRNPDAKAGKVTWLRAMFFERERRGVAAPPSALFGASGKIWGQVLPFEQQEYIKIFSLRMVDKTTSKEQQKAEYQQFRDQEMSKVPHHMDVWLEPRTRLDDGHVYRKSADWFFPGAAVAVWGHPYRGQSLPCSREKVQREIFRFTHVRSLSHSHKNSVSHAHNQGREGLRKRKAKEKRKDGADVDDVSSARQPSSKRARLGANGSAASSTSVDGDADVSLASDDDRDFDPDDALAREDAPVMTQEVALAVAQGANVDSESSVSRAKKKQQGNQLGQHGFRRYNFDEHKASRYKIVFQLLGWTQEGPLQKHELLDRRHVPKVSCEVELSPALPSTVTPSHTLILHQRSQPIVCRIGVEYGTDSMPSIIGFRLVDEYGNEWNPTTLHGHIGTCGIRVRAIETDVPLLTADVSNARLTWSAKDEHWRLDDFKLTMPSFQQLKELWKAEEARALQEKRDPPPFPSNPLKLESATDTRPVKLTFLFDINPDYKQFDPTPSTAAIERLRSLTAHTDVQCAAGLPHSFRPIDFPASLTLVNASNLPRMLMQLEDEWGHPVADAADTQIWLVPSVPYIEGLGAGKQYDIDATGLVKFEPLPLLVPSLTFSHHCKLKDGSVDEYCIEFDLHVQIRVDKLDPVNLRTIHVTLMQRWGPTSILLFPSTDHLTRMHQRVDHLAGPDALPFIVAGKVGDAVQHLYVAFMQESGRLMAIESLQDKLGQRQQHVRFLITGLEGASCNLTLADLPCDGHIESGINLPTRIPTTGIHRREKDGAYIINASIRMDISDHHTESDDAMVDDDAAAVAVPESKEQDEADTAMSAAPSTVARTGLESKPRLSSLLPCSSLETRFTLRLSPGPPVRWQLAPYDNFIFKCALVWKRVRLLIVDAFGNEATWNEEQQGRINTAHIRLDVHHTDPANKQESKDQATPSNSIHESDKETPTVPTPRSPAAPMSTDELDAAPSTNGNVDQPPPSSSSTQTAHPTTAAGTGADSVNEAPGSSVQRLATPTADGAAVASPLSSPSVSTASPAPAMSSSVLPSLPCPSSPSSPSSSTSSSTLLANALRRWHPTRERLRDGSLAPYFVASDAFLIAPVATYYLVLRDDDAIFQPSHPLPIQLAPGAAHRMCAYVDAECKEEVGCESDAPPEKRAECTALRVQSQCKVGFIRIRFYDRGDNPTTCAQTTRLRLITPDMEGQGQGHGYGMTTKKEVKTEAENGMEDVAASEEKKDDADDSSTSQVISGLYPYPLTRILSASQSSSRTIRIKKEVKLTPLSYLSGVVPREERRAVVLARSSTDRVSKSSSKESPSQHMFEEFTLHLHPSHYVGSYIRIDAAEPASGQAKVVNKLKRGVIIPIEVLPDDKVQAITLTSAFDEQVMAATMQRSTDQLPLKPDLLSIPPPISATSLAAEARSECTRALPAGAPLPILTVSLLRDMEGHALIGPVQIHSPTSSTSTSAAAAAASAAASTSLSSPRKQPDATPAAGLDGIQVKKEIEDMDDMDATKTDADDAALSELAQSLLPGLSVSVSRESSGALTQLSHLYHRPYWNPSDRTFVFEPFSSSPSPDGDDTAAPSSTSLPASPIVPSSEYVLSSSGLWHFRARCEEQRESVREVLLKHQLQREVTLTHIVCNGPPVQMRIAESPHSTINSVVGNMDAQPAAAAVQAAGGVQPSQPPASRHLARNLTMRLYDAFGQKVTFDTLAPEALDALKRIECKVTALESDERQHGDGASAGAGAGVGSATSAAATSARPQKSPTSSPDTEVISLIDSDEEQDESMGVPTTATAAASSTSPPSPPAQPRVRVPPQLDISKPSLDPSASLIIFHVISVKAESTGSSGDYQLTFSLPPPFSSRYDCSLRFFFSNDAVLLRAHIAKQQQRQAQLNIAMQRYRAATDRLAGVQRQLNDLQKEWDAARARMDTVRQHVESTVGSVRHSGLPIPDELRDPTHGHIPASSLLNYLDSQCTILQDQTSQARPPVPLKSPDLASNHPARILRMNDGYYGRLVDQAYIDDARMCALISWHMQSNLPTYITHDAQCQAYHQLRHWCQTNADGAIITITGLNQSNFNPHRLPHHSIRTTHPIGVRGNPRYLISLLHFRTQDPTQRQTLFNLFHSLTRSTLVMDSMDDAHRYRQLLSSHRLSCPSILCLRQAKLLSSSNIERFDSDATAPGLARLRYHFEVKPDQTSQMRMQQLAEVARTACGRLRELQVQEESEVESMRVMEYEQHRRRLSESMDGMKREQAVCVQEVERLGGSVPRAATVASHDEQELRRVQAHHSYEQRRRHQQQHQHQHQHVSPSHTHSADPHRYATRRASARDATPTDGSAHHHHHPHHASASSSAHGPSRRSQHPHAGLAIRGGRGGGRGAMHVNANVPQASRR